MLFRSEKPARAGQILAPDSLLRTAKPGRMQVQLANGRQFRLGGDAVLRLGSGALNLEKGQIIAWVNPGQKGGSPLRIRTRVAGIKATLTAAKANTADTALITTTAGGVEAVLAEGLEHHLFLGRVLDKVRS